MSIFELCGVNRWSGLKEALYVTAASAHEAVRKVSTTHENVYVV